MSVEPCPSTAGARRAVRACALRPTLAGGHRGSLRAPHQHRVFASPPGRPRMGPAIAHPNHPSRGHRARHRSAPRTQPGRALAKALEVVEEFFARKHGFSEAAGGQHAARIWRAEEASRDTNGPGDRLCLASGRAIRPDAACRARACGPRAHRDTSSDSARCLSAESAANAASSAPRAARPRTAGESERRGDRSGYPSWPARQRLCRSTVGLAATVGKPDISHGSSFLAAWTSN